jgi:hypothetical protein
MTRMNERQVSNLSAPTNPFGGAFAKRLLPMGLAAFLRGVAPVALVAAVSVPAMAADAPQPGNAQVAEAVAALRAIAALKADFVQSDRTAAACAARCTSSAPARSASSISPAIR